MGGQLLFGLKKTIQEKASLLALQEAPLSPTSTFPPPHPPQNDLDQRKQVTQKALHWKLVVLHWNPPPHTLLPHHPTQPKLKKDYVLRAGPMVQCQSKLWGCWDLCSALGFSHSFGTIPCSRSGGDRDGVGSGDGAGNHGLVAMVCQPQVTQNYKCFISYDLGAETSHQLPLMSSSKAILTSVVC